MNGLIEELKYNQKVNYEKGLENRVDIDYVIERLENIQDFLLENIEYFNYHNKNLTQEQYFKIELVRHYLKK